MKKITKLALLSLVLILSFCFGFIKPLNSVYAEESTSTEQSSETEQTSPETEEESPETETETETETKTEEDKVVLTEEELTEIINGALTEQQKNFVDNIANILSEKLGITHEKLFIIVGGALVVLLLLITLIAKVIINRGSLKQTITQLQATQSAYTNLLTDKESLTEALKSLSAEEIGGLFKAIFEENKDLLTNEITEKLINNLKIDDNTLSTLLSDNKLVKSQLQALVSGLRAVCENNKDLAVKQLSSVATENAVQELALENAKLKAALGEETVAKLLGKKDNA